VLLALGFLALHLEGTVIHDACHNAAHPSRIWNAVMGHGAAMLLGFSFPVFTRVHLQHHAHVNDPKRDPDHIVSTFGPLWLIAPRFFYHEVFFFRNRLWRQATNCWSGEWPGPSSSRLCWRPYKFDFLPFMFNCWFAPGADGGCHPGPSSSTICPIAPSNRATVGTTPVCTQAV
jgi:beta-carotene hydroxylase